MVARNHCYPSLITKAKHLFGVGNAFAIIAMEVVPTNAAIFANGNNLTLVGDMTRRAIGEERPKLRVFKCNPLAIWRTKRQSRV